MFRRINIIFRLTSHVENYRAHIPNNSDMFRSCLPRARGWVSPSTRVARATSEAWSDALLCASMTPFVLRLFALVSAAMSAPVSARPGNSFLPGPANGYGFLVPSPAGGLGCGSLNYVNCFPGVADTLRRWTSQLRSVYASPRDVSPTHPRDLPDPLDARAEVEAEGLHPSLADAHVRLPPRRQRRRLRGDDRRLSPGRRRPSRRV